MPIPLAGRPPLSQLPKPNYSWPVIHLVVFSHLRPGALHISLRTHKTQPRGWKKRINEQRRTWVSSKRKKSEFVTLLCCSPCICRLSRACIGAKPESAFLVAKATRNADSSLDCPVLSTGLFYSLLLTVLFLCQLARSVFSGTFLPSSTSNLAGDLALRPFVWVSRQNRQKDSQTNTHTNRNECYPSCHTIPSADFELCSRDSNSRHSTIKIFCNSTYVELLIYVFVFEYAGIQTLDMLLMGSDFV